MQRCIIRDITAAETQPPPPSATEWKQMNKKTPQRKTGITATGGKQDIPSL
ncbi:MAG: hypothetical protein LBT46_03065 [Planctomycetaceae bacterium]|nr:hypothetical protein [Planctomycetaceae bacterium]